MVWRAGLLLRRFYLINRVDQGSVKGTFASYEAGRLQFFGDHAKLAHRPAFNAYLAPLHKIDWVVFVDEQKLGNRFAAQPHRQAKLEHLPAAPTDAQPIRPARKMMK